MNETSVLASFCFVVLKREEGIAFLDIVVVVSCYWAFYLFLSLLCVCVCVRMAGRYCFRLIATFVVDSSPVLLFTHTHTCRSFSSFILLPKKKTRNIFTPHTYVLILILVFFFFFFFFWCYNSSFLLICCIPFFPFSLNIFSLPLSFSRSN